MMGEADGCDVRCSVHWHTGNSQQHEGCVRTRHSVTDRLGFFRDPPRADGSPEATLICLRLCWRLCWKELRKSSSIAFISTYMGLHPRMTSVTSQGEAILGWGWRCTIQPFTFASMQCCPSSKKNCWYPHSQSTSTQSQASMFPSSVKQAGRGQVTWQIVSTLETGPPFSPIYSNNMDSHPRHPVTV